MGRECEDCRGATPAKPPFERRWRGAPEDRMPRRGITTALSHRSENHISARQNSPLSQEAMRQGAFYLPPLRGTFLQRKACRCVAPRHFYNAAKPPPLIAERSDSDTITIPLCATIISGTKVRAPKRGPGQWRPSMNLRPLFPICLFIEPQSLPQGGPPVQNSPVPRT